MSQPAPPLLTRCRTTRQVQRLVYQTTRRDTLSVDSSASQTPLLLWIMIFAGRQYMAPIPYACGILAPRNLDLGKCRLIVLSIILFLVHPLSDVRRTVLKFHPSPLATP